MSEQSTSGFFSIVLGGVAVAAAVLAPFYLVWRFGLRWVMVGMGFMFTLLALNADSITAAVHEWGECQTHVCIRDSLGEVLLRYSNDGGWWTLAVASWIVVAGMGFIVDVAPNLRRLINGAGTEQ